MASSPNPAYIHNTFSLYLFPLFATQPFETVAPFFKQINDFLERLITWPRDVGVAIFNCSKSFPAPM